MRARLLLIPFIFSFPVCAQNIPAASLSTQTEQVTPKGTVRDLAQLPMDGGWTYQEVIKKAKEGDFQANMLAGEYWMTLYYLNRGDLPLACLEQMQYFFRNAANISEHPAIKLMITDPYGIFGIFKGQIMQPEHTEWLNSCRNMANKGDMSAITALYTVTDLPEAELKRYLSPLEKKARSGNKDALAQLAFIKVDWLKEDPAQVLESLIKNSKQANPALLTQMGELSLALASDQSTSEQDHQKWKDTAKGYLSLAASKGHAKAMRLLAEVIKDTDPEQSEKLLAELCTRGDLETLLSKLSHYLKNATPSKDESYLSLFSYAQELGSPNAYAWYAQLLAKKYPDKKQELEKAAQNLLTLNDERCIPFLKDAISLPQKKLNQLPPYAKTHKELELASQLGDVDASVQLGELWAEEQNNTSDFISKFREAQYNMRIWYKQAAEEGHPLAKLRLAHMDTPSLMDKPNIEPAQSLLKACQEKAATGDFITLKGIAEYVTPEQWEPLIAQLRKKAQEGDARSQAELAYLMLFSYKSQESGYPEALAWARLSAGQGNPCGMYVLGRALIYEFGLENRVHEGYSWLFRSALKGHVEAADMWCSNNETLLPYCAMLHGLAIRGHIPSLLFLANQTAYPPPVEIENEQQEVKNTASSQETPNKAESNNDAVHPVEKSGNELSMEDTQEDSGAVPPWMTPDGKERTDRSLKNINPEAIKLWEQAIGLGSLSALDELADYYESVAQNVQDPAKKQQLLASAMTAATVLVKKEDVRGFKRMARYYEQGIGVQPNKELHKDYILKAAESKDPEALVEKARLLIKGEDMEPNPKQALDILTNLEQTQTQSVPGLYFLLGYLHEEGLGTPQDMALAYQFYLKGAEQNDAKSMNNLGSMYERGTGVAKDLEKARDLYTQAAAQGDEDARANVERINEKSQSSQ